MPGRFLILVSLLVTLFMVSCATEEQSDRSKKHEEHTLPDEALADNENPLNHKGEATDEELPPLPAGIIPLLADSNLFKIDPFSLEPTYRFGKDSLLEYELNVDLEKKRVSETWFSHYPNGKLKSELILDKDGDVQVKRYSYDLQGRKITESTLKPDIMSDIRYYYCGSLLAGTYGYHGIMENWETNWIYYYNEDSDRVAHDFIRYNQVDREVYDVPQSNQMIKEDLERLVYGSEGAMDTLLKFRSEILNGGLVTGEHLMYIDDSGRPVNERELTYGLNDMEEEWSYYDDGIMKRYAWETEDAVGGEKMQVTFNKQGDTLVYVYYPFDQSPVYHEYKYNYSETDKRWTCKVSQENGELYGVCPGKVETVRLEEDEYSLAEQEIKSLKEKIGWDKF